MHNIEIIEVTSANHQDVANLITDLLIELSPSAKQEIQNSPIQSIAYELLNTSKIWAFLAKKDHKYIGVITLHECAAIYAGGIFGEISELYVKPEYRSLKIGEMLIKQAIVKGQELHWQRLEVGSPPADDSPRTINFYQRNGFKCTGSRLRKLI
jgi:GNAT superfamily N-acetyltransferase